MSSQETSVSDALIDQAASLIDEPPCAQERREHDRHPYHQTVTLTLLGLDGKAQTPMKIQAVDISAGGMCTESRAMFRDGTLGIAHLPRSDGTMSVVGVQVCHCRYVGEMMYQTGLRFIPLPPAKH